MVRHARSGENNGCTAVRFAYGGKAGFDQHDVPSSMIPGQSAHLSLMMLLLLLQRLSVSLKHAHHSSHLISSDLS